MLYVWFVPAQTVSGPVMLPGGAGGGEITIVKQVAVLVPHEFDAVTQIFPPVAPKVTVMLVVPCPELIVAPDGTVHA